MFFNISNLCKVRNTAIIISALQRAMQLKPVPFYSSLEELSSDITNARRKNLKPFP